MSDKNFLLFLRFVIIALWYFMRCMIWPVGTIFFYYPVFIPVLILYLILIIISTKVSEGKGAVLRISSNIIFLVLFPLEIVNLLREIGESSDKGEAVFGFFSLILYLPMLILFIVWLVKDIRNHKRMKSQN